MPQKPKPRIRTFTLELKNARLSYKSSAAKITETGPLIVFTESAEDAYALGKICADMEIDPVAPAEKVNVDLWRFTFHEDQFSDRSVSDNPRYRDT